MSHSMTHSDTDTPDSSSGGPSLWRGRIRRGVRALRDRRWGIALVAGLLGALAALLVMGILRLWWGTLTPPELFAERLLPLIPADQFVALLARFKAHPKTDPLGLTLLGQVVLGMLIALPFTAFARPTRTAPARWPARRAWLVAGTVALLMEGLALALFWPVLEAGVYGDSFGKARLLSAISLLLTFSAYAAVTLLADHWLARWLQPATGAPAEASPPAIAGVSRRAALEAGGAVVLALAVGGLAFNRLLAEWFARSNLSYEGMRTPDRVTSAITPNSDFYIVSKNVLDPTVQVDRWQLEITGLIRSPQSWMLSDLRALESESRAITLECISNEVGGHLISTAQWRGVTLETLLAAAGGALPTATHLIFYSVDGYTTSLSLAALLQARTLLAWEMNGEPLPDRHGFPLRAVVAGRYGEQSAKWLSRIELTNHPYKGFYQSQGWSDGPLSTMSRIDTPTTAAAPGLVTVSGIAFAGLRSVTRVEVSADGGANWHDATLLPPLSDQTWRFWQWVWRPPAPGRYTLVVRATDDTGAVQTSKIGPGVPNGATGWHTVQVLVK
ncbi:MAG TPA: molybdopterin-dependent oxidoreductase [Ktedonobacterales bacterium]|nr:molybdopterin-dependent oxidoreductase [Ktedonobacterales bacterium]